MFKKAWDKIKAFFKKFGHYIWKALGIALGVFLGILGIKNFLDEKQIKKNEDTIGKIDDEVEKAKDTQNDADEVIKKNEEIINKYRK
jgi:hypothetical protein